MLFVRGARFAAWGCILGLVVTVLLAVIPYAGQANLENRNPHSVAGNREQRHAVWHARDDILMGHHRLFEMVALDPQNNEIWQQMNDFLSTKTVSYANYHIQYKAYP